jgi:DNA polymerase zeta
MLLGGAIMSRIIQPYEAQIDYKMQFLIDYNLSGCGFLECSDDNLKYRRVHRKEAEDDESDYDMSDQEERYDMLPVDKFPRHSWSGWEVDIQAHHILNRHEINERNLHHDFEENNKSFGQDFKHVHSLDELWKEHGKHANPSASVEDAWTAPSTGREQGTREEWLQEQDFRAQIQGLAKEEERRSGRPASLENLIRKIPHEKFIPTAFESVDYISSFCAAKGKPEPVSKSAGDKMNVDGIDAGDIDVDVKAIYELEEAGLLDFGFQEYFADFDNFQELEQNQEREQEDDFDVHGDSSHSSDENDDGEGSSEMAGKKRKHEDDSGMLKTNRGKLQ